MLATRISAYKLIAYLLCCVLDQLKTNNKDITIQYTYYCIPKY